MPSLHAFLSSSSCCLFRYEILRSCLNELIRTGILVNTYENSGTQSPIAESYPQKQMLSSFDTMQSTIPSWSESIIGNLSRQSSPHFDKEKLETLLLHCAVHCANKSGRGLRKLPLQVFIQTFRPGSSQETCIRVYLAALHRYLKT